MISAFLVALSAFGMFYKPSPLLLAIFAVGVATLSTIVVLWLREPGQLHRAAHQLLADTLADGLLVVDETGTILEHNPAAATLLSLEAPALGRMLGVATRDRSLGAQLQQAFEDHRAQTSAAGTIQVVPARQLTIEIQPLINSAGQPIGALVLTHAQAREDTAGSTSAQATQLVPLQKAAEALGTAAEPVQALAERIGQALALPAVCIARYDAALNDLVIVAEERQAGSPSATGQRAPWLAGELADAWRAGHARVIESPQANQESAALYTLLQLDHGYALALMPLLAADKPIGMLMLAGARSERFDEPTLQLAGLLSGYVALALENSLMRATTRQASRTKSAILDTISHEFRTPITAILGYAELFREESLGPVSADQAEALASIERNTYRLLKLVDDLLDLARLEAGNLELTPTPVNVELCLQEVLGTLRPQLAQRPGALRMAIDPDLPRAWADVLWLRRALTNLLSYTLQTHTSGTISLHASAALGGQVPHSFAVRIAIAWDHPQPADEELAGYFEPFHPQQAGQPQTQTTARIGLAISKHAIDAMGGQLAAERVHGQGQQYVLLLRGAADDEA